MLVLGIDQSLAHTGVFWLGPDAKGWHQVDTGVRRGAERLSFIRNEILDIVNRVKPSLVAMEGYAYGAPGKVFELGELGGILKLTLHELSVPLVVVTPMQVKKFTTGDHTADKLKMVEAVNKIFGFDWTVKENNLADAAALALVAKAYLSPQEITLRHQAEVIAKLRNEVRIKKKRKSRPKKRFHNI